MPPSVPCRVAVLTSVGRGAIATVVAWGDNAGVCLHRRFVAANGTSAQGWEVGRIYFGRFRSLTSAEEELVVCRIAADAWEIHCHGGTAAVAAAVAALVAEGATVVTAADWLNEQAGDVLQREALLALAAATTEHTARILLRQSQGALGAELAAIETLLLSDPSAANVRLQQLLRTWEWGRHLTEPWQVVLCGLPNVGKSSLINALLGYERAIVQDQPGTTRDVVTTHIVGGGWPIALSDTAGWRLADDPVERAGVLRGETQVATADLLIVVTDSQIGWTAELQKLAARRQNVLIVVNKVDLLTNANMESELANFPPRTIFVSARNGSGIADLQAAITSRLVPVKNDAAVLFTERQFKFASEAADSLASGNLSAAKEMLIALRGRSSAIT